MGNGKKFAEARPDQHHHRHILLTAVDDRPSTSELIRQARDGNRQALGSLLARHESYLRLLAQRRLSKRLAARLDATDMVQQTCLVVSQKIGSFSGATGDDFAAWITEVHKRTMQNVVRQHLSVEKRSVAKEQSLADVAEQVEDDYGRPDEPLAQTEAMVELARLLEQLPEGQRRAVWLRHVEGRPLREIEADLGRSEEAVAGLIKRGLQKLRTLM